eukprot:7016651-Pyramimonas_sp.AAC.1
MISLPCEVATAECCQRAAGCFPPTAVGCDLRKGGGTPERWGVTFRPTMGCQEQTTGERLLYTFDEEYCTHAATSKLSKRAVCHSINPNTLARNSPAHWSRVHLQEVHIVERLTLAFSLQIVRVAQKSTIPVRTLDIHFNPTHFNPKTINNGPKRHVLCG